MLIGVTCYSQQFNLTDTVFRVHDVYNPVNKITYPLNGIDPDTNGFIIIDSVIILMKQHDNVSIEIGVHVATISVDVKLVSQRLDVARAEAVMEYMINKGINRNRLTAKGYWMESPLMAKEEINKIQNKKEEIEAHLKNRRTEFKITSL